MTVVGYRERKREREDRAKNRTNRVVVDKASAAAYMYIYIYIYNTIAVAEQFTIDQHKWMLQLHFVGAVSQHNHRGRQQSGIYIYIYKFRRWQRSFITFTAVAAAAISTATYFADPIVLPPPPLSRCINQFHNSGGSAHKVSCAAAVCHRDRLPTHQRVPVPHSQTHIYIFISLSLSFSQLHALTSRPTMLLIPLTPNHSLLTQCIYS